MALAKNETQGMHLIEVAHTTICHYADAAQSLVNIALHLAPERAHRGGIAVLQHYHTRRRGYEVLYATNPAALAVNLRTVDDRQQSLPYRRTPP